MVKLLVSLHFAAWLDILTQVLSSLKSPNFSFGRVLSISVSNNHCNKEGEERKKEEQMSLFSSSLQSATVAFEVNACQYLAATDRQQSHLRTISPFHTFTAVQTEGKMKKLKKEKTKCVKWILSSPVICLSSRNVSGTRQKGWTVTMSFF